MIKLNTQKQSSIDQVMTGTVEQIKAILGRSVSITYKIKVNDVSAEHIIQTVCKVCNTTWSKINDKSKERDIVIPRQLINWCLFHYAGFSLTRIAQEYDRAEDSVCVDHSVVRRSLDRVRDMIDTGDSLYKVPLDQIERCLLKLTEL
jgi:chromosomal replication initiation ATPase DnaA